VKPFGPSILTINGGSSSIKFALFRPQQDMRQIFSGSIDRIGLSKPALAVKGDESADNFSKTIAASDHALAIASLIDWLGTRLEGAELSAIGHRVVHGGPKYWAAQRVTPQLIRDLHELIAYDPEHLPEELHLVKAFQLRYPHLPQVVCFDTAFHHDMPRIAHLLAIPRHYEAMGVRRYGFHGLSYQYLMGELERLAGGEAARGRVILAHLGGGASMAAVHEQRSIDTSMSFTPAAGLVMSTRCGDMDPGLVSFFARSVGMQAPQFDHMANHESGLLGVSETSSDMQDLLAREANDVRAVEAVALFCYQAKKWIGAYAASLGGLDSLVFAGGIGENAAVVRARICEGLGFLGVHLSEERNAKHEPVISTDASRVTVRVIRTDEAAVIAKAVAGVLARVSASESVTTHVS
jgi:acetate kinase